MSFPATILVTLLALSVLTVIGLATGIYSARKSGFSSTWWAEYHQGISTEMVGAVIGALLFTLISSTISYVASEHDLKEELIRNLASDSNGTALNAVEELTDKGWISDGTLRNANLIGANLEGADLTNADLSGADLSFANLSGSTLTNTNLSGATLYKANLSGANQRFLLDIRQERTQFLGDFIMQAAAWVTSGGDSHKVETAKDNIEKNRRLILDLIFQYASRTNLMGADLYGSDLTDSNLSLANLREANLLDANLGGANLFLADLTDALMEKRTFSEVVLEAPSEPISLEDYSKYIETIAPTIGPNAAFTPSTVLPDGRCWTGDILLSRYYNVNDETYFAVGNEIEQTDNILHSLSNASGKSCTNGLAKVFSDENPAFPFNLGD